MMRLNISQSVTRETFKITRKSPPNNPQPHQENGASDATERLKIDNQVAGVNTVALTYGNCSAYLLRGHFDHAPHEKKRGVLNTHSI